MGKIIDIESAIQHCEEVAENQEWMANNYDDDSMGKKQCKGCASDHRQLAEWLKALKQIWDSGGCNNCRNGQCEWKPKLGQLVRFNCPHYVGVANEEVNADEPSKTM